MAQTQNKPPKPLVAIVGTTASGKSAVAMQIALERDGEIICADSRTVYKGMDIGTAKPSKQDQKIIKHHLLDVVLPDQAFSVADFQKLANQAIDDIHKRGKLPILVGGTGLYVDAVLYNFSLRAPRDPKQRQQLQELSLAQLQAEIEARGLTMPNNPQNPRHLIRTIETGGQTPAKRQLRPNTLIMGFQLPPEALKARISARVDVMLQQGLEQEVRGLAKKFGWQSEAMKGIGYREWQAYFDGKQSLEQTKQQIRDHTWQYARRQRTWFRRNPDIQWFDAPEQPSATIGT